MLLAGAGIIIKPENALIILVGAVVVVILVIINDRFNQIDENAEEIELLNRKLDIEKRLFALEREIAEQNGKLSMVIQNGQKSASR